MGKITNGSKDIKANEVDLQNQLSYSLKDKYLSFYINSRIYSIELSNILEIIGIQRITYVPCLPLYIKGTINLRGKIIPIIDMGIRLENKELEHNDRTCIIVIDIDSMQVGLIVDYVHEVVYVSKDQITSIPDYNTINADRFVNYLINLDGSVLLNIDCQKVINSD